MRAYLLAVALAVWAAAAAVGWPVPQSPAPGGHTSPSRDEAGQREDRASYAIPVHACHTLQVGPRRTYLSADQRAALGEVEGLMVPHWERLHYAEVDGKPFEASFVRVLDAQRDEFTLRFDRDEDYQYTAKCMLGIAAELIGNDDAIAFLRQRSFHVVPEVE